MEAVQHLVKKNATSWVDLHSHQLETKLNQLKQAEKYRCCCLCRAYKLRRLESELKWRDKITSQNSKDETKVAELILKPNRKKTRCKLRNLCKLVFKWIFAILLFCGGLQFWQDSLRNIKIDSKLDIAWDLILK